LDIWGCGSQSGQQFYYNPNIQQIMIKGSNKCVTAPSQNAGTQLTQQTCANLNDNTITQQQWILNTANKNIQLAANTNLCMDDFAGITNPGAPGTSVQILNCATPIASNQQWKWQ